MLELLHIENIAVIESADISFRPGFNALTGETGAGKSIVIDAMSAVLGGRASRELIRTGADKAFVSAVFSQVPSTLPGLADNGVTPDEDGNLLLQREIGGDGKNVCRANGRPLTVTQLRQIGGELLNIHGQHDGQQLLDEEQHGAYLDRFGRMEAPLAAYRSAYDAMAAIRDQIRSLQMNEAEKARRMDSLRFQIDELERAELVPGEEEELNARRELLRNGEKYIAALSGADYCLSGDDNGAGAVSAIREAEEALRGIRTLSDELGELYKRLESIRCEVYDLAETIRDKRAEFAFSPAELDAAEARTDQLYRLKKKYGATVEDMIAYLEQCRSELDAMETADDTLILLNGKLKKAEAVVRAAGAELTQKRKAAAQALEQRIQSELRDLDMNKVRFAIEFTKKEPAADGCDVIRFLMSANAGEDLRPIAKVAKISLKLKNRSFITVFISIVFFGAYYFVYFKAQTWLQQIIANAAAYGSAIRGKAYPLYLLGRVGEGDWLAMGIVSAVILGLFALLCLLLSRSFLRIATATGRTARTVYREKAARVSSVSSALLRKELRRFTASPNYMLNCGFGLLFLPAGGILLLVMGSSLAETVSEIFETWPGSVPVLFCTAICLLASMNDMAAPSVSLEGRSAWLLQSLPVRPWQVLRAKLSVQLLLTAIPTAFCAVCAMIVLPGSLPERLLMAAAALVFVLMMALFDLTVGTKWANPAWTNEITPIKQSMSVTLALFGAWFFAIVLGGGYLLLGWHLGCAAYLGIACAVMLGLSALMLGWLRRRGAEKFASM